MIPLKSKRNEQNLKQNYLNELNSTRLYFSALCSTAIEILNDCFNCKLTIAIKLKTSRRTKTI